MPQMVKFQALLATPPTVTTTGTVTSSSGAVPPTVTTILVALQLETDPGFPPKVMLLVPCVLPKLLPVIVSKVSIDPLLGFIMVICGGADATIKLTPLLAVPPTVTTTLPVVAPVGTGTTMLVALQLVGVAVVPLNFTVLVPCVLPKFAPLILTEVPTEPEVGFKLVMVGVEEVTVKL